MASYCGLDCLLHDHLDGAGPIRKVLHKLYSLNGKPIANLVNLVETVRSKFLDPRADIVEAFSNTTGLLQSEETIFEAVRNHVVTRAEEGILYDEFMLAPQYHLFGEFAKEAETDPINAMLRVINAVVAGIKSAEEEHPQIEANFLTAIGRELSSKKAIEVLRAIERSDRNYVVGWNLVCDESAFPPELHEKTFEYADAAEINTEIHASEWVRGADQAPDFNRDLPMLLKNLRTVLRFYRRSKSRTKKRVGHGIALPYDAELMDIAFYLGVGITGCPGSNLQGENIPNLESLRIREMLNNLVLWSMQPDDDFFQPDINEVFRACDEVYRFSIKENKKMRRNAWATRFGNRKPVPLSLEL